MNSNIKFLFLLLITSCKTSSRGEIGIQMTDISLKLPEELSTLDSVVSFSRVDSSAKPKIVKGSEVKVKLPTGIYNIELKLSDKNGNELYHSCPSTKTYSFNELKEDAIVEICRISDNFVIGKTLTSITIAKDPPVLPIPPVAEENKETDDKKPEIQKPTPEENPIDETPLFIEDRTCFGLAASYSMDGREIVIKMNGSIKNLLFDLTNAPKCAFLINIPKDIGQGYSPIYYRLKFSSDAETIKQNFFLSVLAKDDNGLLALPCRSILLSNLSNSDQPYQCSFYDTTPEKFLNVLERNKTPYTNLCAAKSKYIKFEFQINGLVDKLLTEMTTAELRIQAPLPEKCIRPSN